MSRSRDVRQADTKKTGKLDKKQAQEFLKSFTMMSAG
jgi:hypothetical protein